MNRLLKHLLLQTTHKTGRDKANKAREISTYEMAKGLRELKIDIHRHIKKLIILSHLLFLFSLIIPGCVDSNGKKDDELVEQESYVTGYNMNAPDQRFILPYTLREISGLTYIDSTTFACVQDENGILFIYDLAKNKIKRQYTFNLDGDYEGITRVGKTIYVLRSDGTLFEILDYDSKKFKLNSYATGIPAENNEGLCYDAENNRLLIAAKGKIGKGRELKDRRVIYGFDLQTKQLLDETAFDFDLATINEFAEQNSISFPSKEKRNGELKESTIKFKTSAICIHPITKKLFLLSATDHLFFIFDMQGKIEHIEQLDENLFNKAEGITFFGNGDMLITNEAQDKKPTLLRFNYRK